MTVSGAKAAEEMSTTGESSAEFNFMQMQRHWWSDQLKARCVLLIQPLVIFIFFCCKTAKLKKVCQCVPDIDNLNLSS